MRAIVQKSSRGSPGLVLADAIRIEGAESSLAMP